MWLWIFLTLFFLISVVSSIILYFSLRRITQYENLILQFQQIVTFATDKMKLVDSKGHYEADDEVGFFFKQLKELQLLLDGIFETEETEEKTDDENKS